MKLSSLKSIFLSAAFLIIPSTPVSASDGYWREGYWCSAENNYCRENWGSGHNHDRYWSSPNDYYRQPMLESIEYNKKIIKTKIRPRTDICSLVRAILGHCDGYIGFDESRRTHIFRNYSQQQYYQRYHHRDRRDSVPTWPRRGCVYQDKNIRVLCD